jgi:ABC-2 type transport system ATP-binding protein
MAVLTVNMVSKSYNGQDALQDVSLEVGAGKIYGLLGPNGAGKTTLLRIINRILAPDKGEVLLNNKPLSVDMLEHIGYLPEERGLYNKMKVGDHLLYLARLKGLQKQEAVNKVLQWIGKFGMADWYTKRVDQLSKGMQQKVQFVGTVLHNPSLVILDEPFSGFDPVNRSLVATEIRILRNQGATVILSTHDMSSVEELCDEITLINRARTILSGKLDDIKQQYKENVYEVELKGLDTIPGNFQKSGLEIINQVTTNAGLLARVKITGNMSGSELIRSLAGKFEISLFREVLPSVREVFIQHVKASNSGE